MAACCHAPPAIFSALDLPRKRLGIDSTVPRMTPRRIVLVGLLLLALSVGGFAVVEAMRPPDTIVDPAFERITEKWMRDEISGEEFMRHVRAHAVHAGIGGWMLTRRAYRNFRVLTFCGALTGLALVVAGATRSRRRSVASPPGS